MEMDRSDDRYIFECTVTVIPVYRKLVHVGSFGKPSKPQKHLRSGPSPTEGE
jgi:hypothetical protein